MIVLVAFCAAISFGLAYVSDAADGRVDGVAAKNNDAFDQSNSFEDLAPASDVPAQPDESTGASATSTATAEASESGLPEGWQTGKCTAYDPVSIGYSGLTASGIMLDNSIPTVAAPIEHRELLGTKVALCYNGITVVAEITDLGEFSGYGVAFDFAPGTFLAFGYDSAEDWGAHDVLYRYLG